MLFSLLLQRFSESWILKENVRKAHKCALRCNSRIGHRLIGFLPEPGEADRISPPSDNEIKFNVYNYPDCNGPRTQMLAS